MNHPILGNAAFVFTDAAGKVVDTIILAGENGCGKSSVLKAIMQRADLCDNDPDPGLLISGDLDVAYGMKISYVSQDTSFLTGTLHDFCESKGLNESILLAVLRHLDLNREQFMKKMEDFSEGQKKKVLIATSLITPAHLYIWDEPMNFIDVFSRMQIEKLIQRFEPTMLIVEHDIRFTEKVGTDLIRLQ